MEESELLPRPPEVAVRNRSQSMNVRRGSPESLGSSLGSASKKLSSLQDGAGSFRRPENMAKDGDESPGPLHMSLQRRISLTTAKDMPEEVHADVLTLASTFSDGPLPDGAPSMRWSRRQSLEMRMRRRRGSDAMDTKAELARVDATFGQPEDRRAPVVRAYRRPLPLPIPPAPVQGAHLFPGLAQRGESEATEHEGVVAAHDSPLSMRRSWRHSPTLYYLRPPP